MYVRANGRDITTNIESDPNFVLRTVNFTVSEDNGTVEASFVQSGKHLNNENVIIVIRQIIFIELIRLYFQSKDQLLGRVPRVECEC